MHVCSRSQSICIHAEPWRPRTLPSLDLLRKIAHSFTDIVFPVILAWNCCAFGSVLCFMHSSNTPCPGQKQLYQQTVPPSPKEHLFKKLSKPQPSKISVSLTNKTGQKSDPAKLNKKPARETSPTSSLLRLLLLLLQPRHLTTASSLSKSTEAIQFSTPLHHLSRHKNATTTLGTTRSVSQVKSQSNKSLWLKTQSKKQKQSSQKTNANKTAKTKKKPFSYRSKNGYRILANFYFFVATRSR